MIKNIEVFKEKANKDRTFTYKKINDDRFDYFKVRAGKDDVLIEYTSDRSRSYALKRLGEIGADKCFDLEDFADIKTRGVIEGFYSIPWSKDQRIDMLKFMDSVFLNSYIYAPKDDPYHNKKWREFYDLESLADLKDLVDLANDLDIDFIWAIHPGMNKFDFNNYQEELETLLNKYRSLMEIGVKRFALFMDDIDRKEAFENRENHKKLYLDVENFLEEKDLGHLLVVLPFYNQEWIDQEAKEYYKTIKESSIEIMWTGNKVLSPIDDKSNIFFEEISDKKPTIWLNWPVNDYMRDSIFMESFEYFNSSRKKTFASLFANPMNQEELSKIGVGQIASYLWDMESFDIKEESEKSFLEIERNRSLYKISDSFYSSGLYKDLEKPLIEEDEDIYQAYMDKDFTKLKNKVEEKISYTKDYLENYTNEELYQEIHIFIKNLLLILNSINLILEGEKEEAEKEFKKTKDMKIPIYKEYTDDELVQRKVKNPARLEEIYENLRSNYDKIS